MAEIKNNFTGSRMNKDLDSRLVPNNEYRNALNLQINQSEGSDVGTLQNVLGNSLVGDYRNITGINNLQCVGAYADEATNNIYIYLTNNTLSTYNVSASNFIYVYNTLDYSNKKLISGAFLNFSTLNPVLGINLIEKLLFWTDNRNQPRRINVEKALINNYYTTEDQISVARLAPVDPIDLFRITTLNKSVLLSSNSTVSEKATNAGYYTAKVVPLSLVSENKLDIGSTITAEPDIIKATVTSIALSIDNYITSFNISSATNFTEGSKLNLSNITTDQYETSMYDVVSEKLPNSTTDNPYLDPAYPGDATFLENKFVRFSYRYRFEDGEYSLIAPFTQIAFIPKQDGYFISDDEANTYRSTIVSFMENKVNNIFLQIPLPSAANQVYPLYKISSIEILYKESDGLSVSVIESVDVSESTDTFWLGNNTTYSYNYQSKKPYKTLAQKELIRVYDKTPIKALGQEIAGNRIIYSNYQDKFYYPKTLDFNVGFSTKASFSPNSIYSGSDGLTVGSSIKEYPNHSLKQNRNYQVGVVLCDKFGRQSGVILSSTSVSQGELGSGSLYVPYTSAGENSGLSQWPGYSLKIGFKIPISITPNNSTGYPGVYNGNVSSPQYNPLGWYSYKVVVKQTEQEYYNVYLPGVMAAYPNNTTLEIGRTSHTVLINDNINKVPRDLSEVGPSQVQFSSSVVLFPRVNNITTSPYNKQFYPDGDSCIVSTISNLNSLFYTNGVATNSPLRGVDNFYNYISNPLIARISTPKQIGIVENEQDITAIQHLAVFETAPVESRLDIYWETSTVGLISELNDAIASGAPPNQIILLDNWNFNLNESQGAIDPYVPFDVTDSFRFIGADNSAKMPTAITLLVENGNADVVSSKFEIYLYNSSTKQYRIRTTANSYFFYSDSPGANTFTFTISTTQAGLDPRVFNEFGAITNDEPIFTTPVEDPLILEPEFGTTNIYTFIANNGASLGNTEENYTNGLVITKEGDGSEAFSLTPTVLGSATLTAPSNLVGEFAFNIIATDAGGLSRILPIEISIVSPPGIIFTPSKTTFSTDGQIGGESFDQTGTVQITGNNAVFYTEVARGLGGSASIIFKLFVPNPPGPNIEYYSAAPNGPSNTGAFISNIPEGIYNYQILCELYQAESGSQGITTAYVNSYQVP